MTSKNVLHGAVEHDFVRSLIASFVTSKFRPNPMVLAVGSTATAFMDDAVYIFQSFLGTPSRNCLVNDAIY